MQIGDLEALYELARRSNTSRAENLFLDQISLELERLRELTNPVAGPVIPDEQPNCNNQQGMDSRATNTPDGPQNPKYDDHEYYQVQ